MENILRDFALGIVLLISVGILTGSNGMQASVRKYGRTAGGVYALAAAGAFWFDMKGLGFALAICALALVVSAEHTKNA